MNTAPLSDALADALGRIVADVQREWRKDVERLSAESRVVVAELRLQVVTLTSALKDASDQQAARVAEAIAAIKNGDPGERGKDADPQAAAEIAAKLVSDELSGIIRADVAAIHAGIEEMGAGLEVRVADQVTAAVAGLPAPKDGEPGRSVDTDDVDRMVADRVAGVFAALPPPLNGKDADPAVIAEMVASAVAALPAPVDIKEVYVLVATEVGAALKARPVPADGHTPTVEELAALIDTALRAAVDALPKPKDGEDGRSVEPEEVERVIADLVDNAVAKLPPPEPGKNADPEEVRAIIVDLVDEAVAQLPDPEPGKSVTPADVADMISAEVAAAVAALPAPKDGESVPPAEVERMVASHVLTAMERALAANDDCVPDELAETVSRAIRTLAESPAPAMAFCRGWPQAPA